MKILIEKRYDKVGDDYLKEDEVVVDIYTHKDEVIMKVDGALYAIPKIVIKALLLEDQEQSVVIKG